MLTYSQTLCMEIAILNFLPVFTIISPFFKRNFVFKMKEKYPVKVDSTNGLKWKVYEQVINMQLEFWEKSNWESMSMLWNKTQVATMAVWEAAFFTALNCLPMFIGSCTNFSVILSSLLFISVQDIEGTSLFLVSLSVADFLVCAVYQPLLIICFNQPDQDRSFVLTSSSVGHS